MLAFQHRMTPSLVWVKEGSPQGPFPLWLGGGHALFCPVLGPGGSLTIWRTRVTTKWLASRNGREDGMRPVLLAVAAAWQAVPDCRVGHKQKALVCLSVGRPAPAVGTASVDVSNSDCCAAKLLLPLTVKDGAE